ncbi:hypothetical protein QJS83_00630 [Bdellovibrio sp. 22V]|uniref:hypothetical protein n=1 Tax=Bdellovibrio TaxID=958 RepID=UPI002542DC04|nr:hypothetical protein [Bdellovibrio sp. 22V]WII72370.1 hypothetical protein QJS83_00630 [Bdellovibrio sp. 22V]
MGLVWKTIISIFIAVHLSMVIIAGLPDRSLFGQRILKKLELYQVFLGLDQPWSMFAPNPSPTNSYIDAEITFNDSSTEKWTFPRSSRLDSWERFTSGERVRKFSQENLIPMQRPELWLDLSRFLEREINKIEAHGRGRTVASVQFYRHVNTVKPPTEQFIEHGKLSTVFNKESVYQYKPTQELRHEAKNDH